MFNAQERTLRETVALARSAGWRVTRVTRAQGSLFGHILAVPCEVPAGAYDDGEGDGDDGAPLSDDDDGVRNERQYVDERERDSTGHSGMGGVAGGGDTASLGSVAGSMGSLGAGPAQGTNTPAFSFPSNSDLHGLVDGLGLTMSPNLTQSERASEATSTTSESDEKRDLVVGGSGSSGPSSPGSPGAALKLKKKSSLGKIPTRLPA